MSEPTTPAGSPPSRNRVWPGWAIAGLLVAGAAALVGGLVGTGLVGLPGGSSEPVNWEERFASACATHFRELTGSDRPMPAGVSVEQEGGKLRLYATGGKVFVCRSADPMIVATSAFPIEPARASGQLQLLGGETAAIEELILVGRVPPGTDRVTARLVTGHIVTGITDGDLFVVWPPLDAPVAGAEVFAHGPAGVLGTATAPAG